MNVKTFLPPTTIDTFRQWLNDQQHRQDYVGNIARDAAQGVPLDICGGNAGRGVVRAWREYQRSQRQIAARAIRAAKRGQRSIA